MARPIDGDALKRWCEKIIDQACHPATVQIGEVFLDKVRSMPTLTPSNEWVSVENAMPPEHKPVLCIASGRPKPNIMLEDAYQLGSWNKADGWIIDEYLDWEDADVSWWMPLPEPPGKEKAITALSRPNEPLTLEELREMSGEPVWIVEQPDWGHWELSADAEDYLADRDQDFYGLKHDDPAGRYGLHVLGWLAYRRPPEGEA